MQAMQALNQDCRADYQDVLNAPAHGLDTRTGSSWNPETLYIPVSGPDLRSGAQIFASEFGK